MRIVTIHPCFAGHTQSWAHSLRLLLQRCAYPCLALATLAALAFGTQPARAAVTEAWVHHYNNVVSNANDQAIQMVSDAAGDIIVTGTTDNNASGRDMLTIKYSAADGSVLWQHRYNGPANRDDVVTAVAVDSTGNVVVTGHSHNATAIDENGNRYNGVDYYAAKYAAADGSLIWGKRYNSPGNPYNYANAVAVDGSGNVVVTGHFGADPTDDTYAHDSFTAKYAAADGALLWERRSNGPATFGGGVQAVALDDSGNVVVTCSLEDGLTTDYYTAKYAAADGALLWEQSYNSPGDNDDVPTAVAVDSSGNVVVTGTSNNGRDPVFGNDYYTAKYAAANGALLWETRSLGGYANALVVGASGNVVVTGSSNGDPTGADYYTVTYAAANGALLWEKRSNNPANSHDDARAVVVDGSGNVIVAGGSTSASGYHGSDCYTAKYAAVDGALLWEKRGPGGGAGASALAVDGSGNVLMTGSGAIFKYAAGDGALLWEKRYEGPAEYGYAFAQVLAVDGSGNVVATGWSYRNHSSFADYYTAKYAAADGALLWEQRYNGPENGEDFPTAVVVDGGGNAVVTGRSASSGLNEYYDYYTAKYAAADGALLWEQREIGPDNSQDYAQAVAVDGSGNVVVTGNSNRSGAWGYYTVKYAAADGALLWEQRYNSSTNSYQSVRTVAVDGSGNVTVTGSGVDWYTAKYAAGDGALLWEKRGPGGGDGATALAVDARGNVVVTGSSGNGAPHYGSDYYTAKYASADGALLWEQRYNGSANGNDSFSGSRSLALGPNGMVAVTGSSSGDFATVVYRETLPPVAIELVPTGVRLRFTGTVGLSYNIERASAVTGPWSTINTQPAPASGLLEYLDTLPHPGSGFYRTVQP